MAGHYDVPLTGSWHPEILLRWPNLGQPCFVRKANGSITFRVLCGGVKENSDVSSLLAGRLFLQSLSDTRQILQDKKVPNIKDMDNLPSWLQRRLIPLTIERVEAPVRSSWFWYEYGCPEGIEFSYAYWVTLKIEARHLRCLNWPQLFNLIQDFPDVDWYNVNFHSVYIHNKDWHDFRFIQATDTHIAWRNDTIPEVFAPKHMSTGSIEDLQKLIELRGRYINFNQNFRDLIRYANILHRQGKLDFIMLTGDIIDFVHENFEDKFRRSRRSNFGKTPYYPRPIDNFEFFRELLTSWGSKEGIWGGEELAVPIFTVLGNHDYRRNEYPLIFKLVYFWAYVLGQDVSPQKEEPISEYKIFGLNEQEALDFEGGLRRIHRNDAQEFVDYFEDAPASYTALINPDRDYVIQLGKHKIVCLDSSHDEGVPEGIIEYLFRGKSGSNFVAGSPDSAGFCQEQIDFLANEIQDAAGLLIIASHAPLLNLRHTPHHLLRETEHCRKLSNIEKKELLAFILANRPEATEIDQAIHYGKYILDLPTGGIVEFFKNLFGKSPMKKMREEGWPFGRSDVFKASGRDPFLGWGVVAHRFKEFLETIESRVNQDETAVLILTGHTHKNIEYVVTLRGSGSRRFIRYYHDYYIDNTIHGRRPQGYWLSEDLPDYDPKSQKPPEELWHHRSPLFVQTLSLGPRPSAQTPNEKKAKLVGYSKVQAGHFSLYNLRTGTYKLVFESRDNTKSAIGGFDVSDKNAEGKELISLLLQAKPKEPGEVDVLGTLGTGSLQHNWGQGNTLVVRGTVRETSRGRLISGAIAVYEAPPPEGGVLLVTVLNDVIANIERVYLSDMREEKLVPPPTANSAYLVLSTSTS